MLLFRKATPLELEAQKKPGRAGDVQTPAREGDSVWLEVAATGDVLEARVLKVVVYHDFEFTEHAYYTCQPLGLVKGDQGRMAEIQSALGEQFDVKSNYVVAVNRG